ncbi:MAG TPA: mechanosensitive ion channel [Verrucomicrobiota bacterium]|nr:mechanosensitive ion channel [Verrucomicrobiota bacterium]
MNEMLEQLRMQFAAYGPNLLAGLAVLVVGWLLAVIVSSAVRKLMGKVSIDNKIAQWMAGPDQKSAVPVERWISQAVFYVLMFVVLIAFLQTIKLTLVTESLNSIIQPVLAYLPRLVGASVLLAAAWILATVLRKILVAVFNRTKLDEKVGTATGGDVKSVSLSETFAEVVYWLVFLLFLPPILQTLGLESLLAPVTTLLNEAFGFLPNILSAAAILVIGWFIARIVQRLVESLLAGAGLDRASEKWGIAPSLGARKLSSIVALIVYFVILVPVLIAALGALQIEAVTRPASDMLAKIMAQLPDIAAAAIIILIAVVAGKVVSGIITNILTGIGFNNVLVRLGLSKKPPQEKQLPSVWVGNLIFAVIVILASVTAAETLGFTAVAKLITDFVGFAGHVLMGLLIFSLGLLLARLVAEGIASSDSPNARRLALVARVAILTLAGAMALRQTGLANEIVNLAFGIILGAVAVAFAIAFGMGGRDMASRTLEDWKKSGQEKSQ